MGQTTFTLQSAKWNSVQCCAVNLWIDVPNVWGNSWDFPSSSPNDVVNACVELLRAPLSLPSPATNPYFVRFWNSITYACAPIVVLHYCLQNERKNTNESCILWNGHSVINTAVFVLLVFSCLELWKVLTVCKCVVTILRLDFVYSVRFDDVENSRNTNKCAVL
jgi:hypothetical protein